ncbi:Hypothetical predicted protein, partial [Paramuricea clavata]
EREGNTKNQEIVWQYKGCNLQLFSQKMMIPGRSRFGTYQPTHSDKAILGFAILVNCLLLILALGALFVGIFLNTYRGSYADLCSDNEWFVAAGCMLAVGSLLLIFVILSFVAMCYKSSRLLSAARF